MKRDALREYLKIASNRRQRFGTYDCVRFVADCLLYGWGKDYHSDLEYWNRPSAVKRLRKAGGLRAACTDLLGPEVQDLREGDVAYFDDPVATVGIVVGEQALVFMNNTIWRLELSSAAGGWRP